MDHATTSLHLDALLTRSACLDRGATWAPETTESGVAYLAVSIPLYQGSLHAHSILVEAVHPGLYVAQVQETGYEAFGPTAYRALRRALEDLGFDVSSPPCLNLPA